METVCLSTIHNVIDNKSLSSVRLTDAKGGKVAEGTDGVEAAGATVVTETASVEAIEASTAIENTMIEAPAAESKDDNAEEIEALVNNEAAAAGQSDEPKPVSIDELDNGSIFGTEDSKEEESNNRQPIQLDDEKPTE